MESTNLSQSQQQQGPLKLNFVNTILNTLPIDENIGNKMRQVSGFNYSKTTPTPLKNPRIVSLSDKCLTLLDLDKEQILSNEEMLREFTDGASGNKLFEGSAPLAHNYCGHQFGYFAGQLGDGRAITLGDIRNKKGELWELQLKGAGQTPYSRQSDGRAVLRSSIREYLASEAMEALGIPTTRAASLLVSDTTVVRDPIYSGNAIQEPCAVVMRVAPSFFRFGSFEIFKESDRMGPSAGLKQKMIPKMLEYVIKNYYPEIHSANADDLEKQYKLFFEEVVKRTTKMVALWQCYGFCHGVLNTDNLSILGLTIDYGPYAFMEHFKPDFICNYSDKEGRYSYENQPAMVKWDLLRLAEALDPYVDQKASHEYIEKEFDTLFSSTYLVTMGQKLGFITPSNKSRDKLNDMEFECIKQVFKVMKKCGSDMTNTFRIFSQISRHTNPEQDEQDEKILSLLVSFSAPKAALVNKTKSEYGGKNLEMIKKILEIDPELLRKFGIDPDAARKEVYKSEKQENEDLKADSESFEQYRPIWSNWITTYKDCLSLLEEEVSDEVRKVSMDKFNPKFILRNYLMEEAIREAQDKSNYSKVDELLALARDPFSEANVPEVAAKQPPEWAFDICISCSS